LTTPFPGYLIQVSGASLLSIPDIVNKTFGEGPRKMYGDIDDADEIRDIIRKNADKRVVDSFLINVTGAKTAIVFPPIIYGQGRGPINQRSIQVPEISRVAIEKRQTFQVGKGESTWSNIHISDLSNIFVSLVEKAVEGAEGDLWNQNGLYFVSGGPQLVSWPLESIMRRPPSTESS
jgi:nucleoside-diphosphate-sugar epimerase